MGACIYCHEPAGLLSRSHAECAARHSGAVKRTHAELVRTIKSTDDFTDVQTRVARFAEDGRLTAPDTQLALVTAWEAVVDQSLEDGVLDPKEEHRLVSYKEHFRLSQQELDRHGSLTRLAQAATLRDLLGGRLPRRMAIESSLPINLRKNETVVWVFKAATLLQDKTQRTYEGSSQGMSVRVMKGVYYRVGAYRGRPVDRTVRVEVGKGLAVVTDQNIYFAGDATSLRIPLDKIVSFHPFTDGIGLVLDTANAKMQFIVTGDGWFIHNLAANLAKLRTDG